ncbi:hypothetical protein Tco_0681403 [Tanacetum coccineum]|uniref:Uncharacterized protein n=1 Tax=Tanacetum coccineum TaxID=301880 RepID=A0ABQ4XNJ5_9ASTR
MTITMSSPNRSTSDIEDAFSSMNILNYTSVSSDYFPASSGSISFNSSEDSNIIPLVISSFYNNPCLKDLQAFYDKELHISPPDPITSPAILTPSPVLPPSLLFDPRYFFIPEELLPPKKRIRSPSFSSATLYELSFHRIEKMEEGRINDRMIIRRNGNELKTELKRIRTQILKLQKKQLGQKDKIVFAHCRISDLEQIIEKIQAHHQTDQEDLLVPIIFEHSSSLNIEDTSVQDTILIPNPPIPSVVTLALQDRWSQDKHIKLVNIIGNPRSGMLTIAMAKQLSAASAYECLFVDFLS